MLAVLAVMAAVALPALIPVLRHQQLFRVAEQTADLLAAAQRRALLTGRCVRVAPAPGGLQLSELNSHACEAWLRGHEVPRFDPGLPPWGPGEVVHTQGQLAISLRHVAPPARHDDVTALAFLPSGRLAGAEAGSPARVVVSRTDVEEGPRARTVLVEPHGRICVLRGEVGPEGRCP